MLVWQLGIHFWQLGTCDWQPGMLDSQLGKPDSQLGRRDSQLETDDSQPGIRIWRLLTHNRQQVTGRRVSGIELSGSIEVEF
jgi:hypothetical protein